ncbi:MAG TPA: cupredoxin domain-containing protein [Gaiellaceae bacterium]|nr:cupredoxin domain-containing protein [Gaiellaceae bacterium]
MRRLALVVALACLASPAAAAAADRDVAIRFNRFQPADLVALTGDRVVWANGDPTAHNVTATGFPSSGTLEPGARHEVTFPAAGRFGYRCTLHGGMSGVVSVYDLYLAGPAVPIRHGRTATLTGLAPPSSSVMIHSSADGNVVTTVDASASGSFSATIAGVPGRYIAMAGDRTSTAVQVAVQPRVSLRYRRGARRVVFTIAATPAQTGAPVALERRHRSGWRRLARGRLNARSHATFRVTVPRGTRVRARLVQGVGGYSPSTSGAIRVR